MKTNKKMLLVLSGLVLVAMLIASCAPAATPAPVEATEAPAAVEATEAPAVVEATAAPAVVEATTAPVCRRTKDPSGGLHP